MIIQLMGPQACGKGTQGEMLSKRLGLPLIGVGDLLRDIPPNHPKYRQIQNEMEKGELVEYKITAEIIKERILKGDCNSGYILDGWGRVEDQFKYFDPNPDKVIFLNIPRHETIKRISGRRVCEPTGEIINIFTLGPEELKKCPGPLIQREDDTEEAIKRRLEIFDHETTPVINKYKTQGKLLEISGLGTPEEVFDCILKALEVGTP